MTTSISWTGRTIANGQYLIQDLIGHGAVSLVYQAWEPSLQRSVAVKVLSSKFQPDSVDSIDRFRDEAITVAKLEHPNIIPIYGHGVEDDVPFIVMRLLTGGTLQSWIDARAKQKLPLPSLTAVGHLLEQIARALDYAHANGIIHRDIKPSNILFDENGGVYVADFGIAKSMEASSINSMRGTPAYMAPEQWRGGNIGPATDQYAVGLIIYTLLAGKYPFATGSLPDWKIIHSKEILPNLSEYREDVTETISQAIAKATEKARNKRFKSIGEFATAFVSGIPPTEGIREDSFSAPLATKARIDSVASPIVESKKSDIHTVVESDALTEVFIPQPPANLGAGVHDRELVPRQAVVGFLRRYTVAILVVLAAIFLFMLIQPPQPELSPSATPTIISKPILLPEGMTPSIITLAPTSPSTDTPTVIPSAMTTDTPTVIPSATTTRTSTLTLSPTKQGNNLTAIAVINQTATESMRETSVAEATLTPTCFHHYTIGHRDEISENQIARGLKFFIFRTIDDYSAKPQRPTYTIDNGTVIEVTGILCWGRTAMYRIRSVNNHTIEGWTDREDFLDIYPLPN